jgi:hypothetical protein
MHDDTRQADPCILHYASSIKDGYTATGFTYYMWMLAAGREQSQRNEPGAQAREDAVLRIFITLRNYQEANSITFVDLCAAVLPNVGCTLYQPLYEVWQARLAARVR